jgi:hypothetical protein
LAVGTHTLLVTATDRNGRTAKASVSWTVVVSAAPFTFTSSITSGSTLSGSVSWTATPSQSASAVDFYIDGALRWTERYAPFVYNGDGNTLDTTALVDGNHVLKVVGTASDGTKSETSATVRVDNGSSPASTSPSFTVTSSIADNSTLSAPVSWQATPSRAVVRVDFYVDGSLRSTDPSAPYFFNGDSGRIDTTALTNGRHSLRVVATAADTTTAAATAAVQVVNSLVAESNTAGRPLFMEKTSPATDSWTNLPSSDQQQWFRDHWYRTIVYSPYWDSRNSWYAQTWAYEDAYAIYNPSTLASQHPEWILKDASGNKLYIPWGCSNGTCPQYAADIGNPGWRQYFIDLCKAVIAKGYKGLHIDDVNMGMTVGNGAGQDVAPIDPRTGEPMTDDAWKSYFAEFMEQLRAALPGVEIAHNAVWFAGGGQHDGTNPYVAREIRSADFINLERGFNDGGLTGGTGSWSVFALMRFIDNVHSAGGHIVVQGYAGDLASAEYNLAAYLLISDGRDLVSSSVASLPGQWWAGYDVDLGAAIGGRYLWNGVWRRDFTNGVVLLNEPGATTKSLGLGGTYTTTSGQSVSGVTLTASRGAVFKTG